MKNQTAIVRGKVKELKKPRTLSRALIIDDKARMGIENEQGKSESEIGNNVANRPRFMIQILQSPNRMDRISSEPKHSSACNN